MFGTDELVILHEMVIDKIQKMTTFKFASFYPVVNIEEIEKLRQIEKKLQEAIIPSEVVERHD